MTISLIHPKFWLLETPEIEVEIETYDDGYHQIEADPDADHGLDGDEAGARVEIEYSSAYTGFSAKNDNLT